MATTLLTTDTLLELVSDLPIASKLVHFAVLAENEDIRIKAALLLAYGNAPAVMPLEDEAFEYFKAIGLTAVYDNPEFDVWNFHYER